MIFTPQARRRISNAVQALDQASQALWAAWTKTLVPNQAQAAAPHDITLIALRALIEAEQKIEEQLTLEDPDDDLKADLLNDLVYVRAIKAALQVCVMSGSPFGPGEMDVLHALSLRIRLFLVQDRGWISDNGVAVPMEVINSLIKNGFAEVQNDALNITDKGRVALSEEIDLNLKRIPEWLKTASGTQKRYERR